MNITALNKLENSWVKWDWSDKLIDMPIKPKYLSQLIDVLDNWKSNKRCKEVVIMKYKSLPAYISLKRTDFVKMSDWLMKRLTELELYEECSRLNSIKKEL
jgi:hypothetical protein